MPIYLDQLVLRLSLDTSATHPPCLALSVCRHFANWYCKSSVCPSVRPSVRDVEVSWSNRLEFLENNFTLGVHSADPNNTVLL